MWSWISCSYSMSLYSYFKKTTNQPLLPRPRSQIQEAANKSVARVLSATTGAKKKRKCTYQTYSDEIRARIGRYAAENGNKKAVTKFSGELGSAIPESSVRNMKNAYLKQLDKVKSPEQIKKLPHSSRGRPLKLGEYDDIVKEYVHHLRLAGGIINRSIVIAAARGILSHLAPVRLKEHGGDIEIERSWAQSFLGRLGYVRRKGTKAARKFPANFEEIKTEFTHRVSEACKGDDDLLAKYGPVSE